MLVLVGLGLHDEKDLTLRGIEEAKNADEVFIELYTSKWYGNIKNLEDIIDKKITQLSRSDLEENSEKFIQLAKEKDVVIFVQGDPLVATTHSALLLEARKQKIATKIIHNTSIISAISETGLHIYKFGATVTIPFLEKTKGKLPESVYETIKENKKRGLHTLCLLDVVEDKILSIDEAVKILFELENAKRGKIFSEDSSVVVCSNLGSESFQVTFKTFRELLGKNFDSPSVLIIPGNLHFTEKDFLNFYF